MRTRVTIGPQDGFIYSFSRDMVPVCEIDLDQVVEVKTLSALHGLIPHESGKTQELDLTNTNPATGPIFVKGIRPGDMVGIDVLAIDVESTGVGMSLGDYRVIPIVDGFAQFSPEIRIRIRPHIGVIGVAPATGSFTCGFPGEHGGNLDTKEVRPGSTIVLPANVEGGLLALGDVHAVMADGEVNGAGLEVGARVVLRVRRVEDSPTDRLHIWTQDKLILIASADSFEIASRMAIERAMDVMSRLHGLSRSDAKLLLGYCGELRVSQIVNPLITVKLVLPRELGIKIEGMGVSV
ncbi:MAG: hypothetical protein GX855_09555 [Firmicutes bacterium]|nr:hypothetical protein [Bacillota bacterium]